MNEPKLINVLNISIENKPKMGDACNSCGYCCLTEVCAVGQELTGSSCAPCKLLISEDDKHYCQLAKNETTKKILGIGTGCCAETQNESLARLFG